MTDPIVDALMRRVTEIEPEISHTEYQIMERENRLQQVRDYLISLRTERDTLLDEVERRQGYRNA